MGPAILVEDSRPSLTGTGTIQANATNAAAVEPGMLDAANGLGALHIVSAWASEEGIALGQVATEEKSNEITAMSTPAPKGLAAMVARAGSLWPSPRGWPPADQAGTHVGYVRPHECCGVVSLGPSYALLPW